MFKYTKKFSILFVFLGLFVADSQAQNWSNYEQFDIQYKLPSEWWVDGFGDYSPEGWDEHGSSVCHCTGVIVGIDKTEEETLKMVMYPSTKAGLTNPERQKVWDFEWVEPSAAQENIHTASGNIETGSFDFEFKIAQWKDNSEFEVWQLKTWVDKDFYLIVYIWASPKTMKANLKTLFLIISSIGQKGKSKKSTKFTILIADGYFNIDNEDTPKDTPKDTFSLELLASPSGKKWGFIDAADSKVSEPQFFIAPIYDYVEEFDNSLMGYAIVGIGKKYGMIDRAGKIYIPLKYDSMVSLNDLAGDACTIITADNKYGAICPNGEEIVPCVYKKAENIAINSIYYAVSKKGKKYGVYNIATKAETFSDTFDEVPMLNPLVPDDQTNNVIVIKNKKYGVLDMETSKFLLECAYSDVAEVQEAYAKKYLDN